jgi:hypothetical protein
LVALSLAASVAGAEGVGPGGGADLLRGVQTLLSTPAGLVSLGGPALRRLAPGARRWETLDTVAGDNLYRIASDDAGRLLAAWERESAIHLVATGSQLVTLPKPVAPPGVQNFQVSSLAFSSSGAEALVFMGGNVKVAIPGFTGSAPSTSAYRIALDGKSPPVPLFRLDHAQLLHASRYGAVFATSKSLQQACDARACPVAAVVAYEITGGAAEPHTLFDGRAAQIGRVRTARDARERGVTLLLEASTPPRLDVLRWRFGDAAPTVTTLPTAPNLDTTTFLTTRDDALVEFAVRDGLLELSRHTAAGKEPLANLGELQDIDTKLHSVGERADGALWLQWGDHVGLVSPGRTPRGYDLKRLLTRRTEWAGVAIYVRSPEALWVGIDGTGRDFARVSFADIEKGAKPWAPGAPIERTRGEAVGYDPKDPSTADRLYNAVGVREMKGGLFALGGPSLRRFVTGARKWETLHVIPKDSVYRVAADADGTRLLAAWEGDPNVHLFAPGGTHLTFPKPGPQSPPLGKYQVDHLEFLPGGRDALVIVQGQLKNPPPRTVPEPVRFYYASWATEAYRVPLDGKFQPQLLYREDYGLRVHDSKHGSVFALPKHPGQQCEHITCFPITEIVAYEITDAGVRRQTVLRGDGWGTGLYLSGALEVRGSDHQHLAMVVSFTRNEGKRWMDGGRGLVRWRWGQPAADYRPLPGHTSTTPRWLLTRNDDFVELVEHWGKPDRLEIKRYLAAGGEQSTFLTAQLKMQSPHGLGERADAAGLWLQWGEHLALLPPGQPPRSIHLDALVQRGSEWAGAQAYVSTPEAIWVGLDGKGRSYVRVDLPTAERRSKPWP